MRAAGGLEPALCILIRRMTGDKVLAGLKDFAATGPVLRTSLANEQEAKPKDALASQVAPWLMTAARGSRRFPARRGLLLQMVIS